MKYSRTDSGFSLPAIITLMVVLSILFIAVATIITTNLNLVRFSTNQQKALNIAEAGINYYLWHLSHAPHDYWDSNPAKTTYDHPDKGYGPYVHPYYDGGKQIGTYELWVKPLSAGSTLVAVQSVGRYGSGSARTIEAHLGAPSFANYSVLSDGPLWFGNTETADGPVHSNVGIRMDGASNADITSSKSTYVPPGELGGDDSTSRPGVWCSANVTTPVNCATRDKSGWRPNAATGTPAVPSVDFNMVSGSLCEIKKASNAAITSCLADMPSYHTPYDGVLGVMGTGYLPQIKESRKVCRNGGKNCYYEWKTAWSAERGYLIEFTSNSKYNLYEVTAEADRPTSSTYKYTNALTRKTIATNLSIPANRVIFAEDNVWVAAQAGVKIADRLTIAVGRMEDESVKAQIKIASPLEYSTLNGNNVLGLIAEGDVKIAPYAPPQTGAFTFKIHASIISQTGGVSFVERYKNGTGVPAKGWTNANQKLEYYGSIASRQVWTWLYTRTPSNGSCTPGSLNGDAVCGSSGSYFVTGILNSTTQYDRNLRYAPPPFFPITSTMDVLSWREVLTQP